MNERGIQKEMEAKARARVASIPHLAKHVDIIFYDWDNWDKHIWWIITAPIPDIIDWVDEILSG